MHVAVAMLALVATVTLVAGLARQRDLSAPLLLWRRCYVDDLLG